MNIYNISNIILEAVSYIAMHFFFLALFGRVRIGKRIIFVYLLSFVLCNCLYINFPQMKNAIIAINLVTSFVICYQYTFDIIRSILGSIFHNVFGISVELIVSFLLANIYKMDYKSAIAEQMFFLLGSAICKMVLIFITYNMYLVLKKRELFKRPGYFCIIAILFPVCSIFILYFLMVNAIEGNLTDFLQVLLVTGSIFIMNIIVFVFYDQICNSQIIKEERDRIQYYVELQQSEQSKVDIYNKKIIKIRHDMKNYVLGIESLIKNEHYAEALTELSNISQNVIKTPAVISTVDSVVNHILNAKMWNMNQENITFERRINIEKEIPINAGDMSVMLGNALDNAIEYVMTHKNVSQVIRMDMMYQGNVFVVKVQNQVEEDIIIPKDMILKTTKESGGHGVGMKSVKEICSRYNGTFVVTCKDKVFMEEIRMILNGEYDVKGSGM